MLFFNAERLLVGTPGTQRIQDGSSEAVGGTHASYEKGSLWA